MKSLESELKKLRDQQAMLRAERDKLAKEAAQAAVAKATVETQKAESAAAKSELQAANEEISHLLDQIEGLKSRLDEANDQYYSLQQELKDQEESNGQSAPARALNLNLQRAKELVNMTIENVAKEHLTNHTSVISGATQGTNTTVGLSFDDMTAKVTGVMVGGPAFNSKKINKDDVIVKIDGQQVQGNQVLDLLRGSDQPGSVVEITLKRTSVSAFMIWNAASAAA